MENDHSMIEPGLIRVFKLFVFLQIALFVSLVAMDVLLLEFFTPLIRARNILSVFVWSGLYIYLSVPRLHKILKQYYLPIALIVTSVFPMISNQPILRLTIEKNLPAIVFSVWQLLPALFVPLVLISWQYPFKVVVIFCAYTGLFDFYLLTSVSNSVYIPLWIVMGLATSRTISFGVVGYMITNLMKNQRAQRAALQQANLQLIKQAEALEQLTITRERNRLARELHDTLAHTLSGMAVNLEAIKTLVPKRKKEVQKMLDHSLIAARKGLSDTRRALRDLRSTQLEDLGLSNALQHLLRRTADRGELKLTSYFPDYMPELLPDEEQAVYRFAQEALENTLRHAQATEIEFVFETYDHHGYIMKIMDNGVGVSDHDINEDYHFGIRGMQERAESIGAKFEMTSEKGFGTEVILQKEVPIDSHPDL
jgi:signal transduction histidine kinase